MIVAELREDLDESQRQLETKERELAESQDRTTALEDQLQEYAGTIQDQSRVRKRVWFYKDQNRVTKRVWFYTL